MGRMTTIAIIGAGAMGSWAARRLTHNGCTVLTWLEGRSAATGQRAADAGMQDASLAEIAGADMILSIVPPAQAAAVVEALAPVFAGPNPPPFCDANAIAPENKRQLAERVAELGGRLIDGSIIGGPITGNTGGPRFYLCGEGAEDIARLREWGIETRIIAGPLGAAATLKMCYAGINKGTIGLVTAMLLAARRHGAAEDLIAEMALTQRDVLERQRYGIPSMYPRAYRWDSEMHEIASFLGAEDPAAAAILEGLGRFYTDRAAACESGEELEALKKLLS
jgi:3-hydroxyisobutyrate dehydrogenase-like beta-hydroxyacid dehydrogenase